MRGDHSLSTCTGGTPTVRNTDAIKIVLVDVSFVDIELSGGPFETAFAEMLGGPGNDVLTGAATGDFLEGGPGTDRIDGMQGDDEINGGSGRDRLVRGAGADAITSRDAVSDFVSCCAGHDRGHPGRARRGQQLRAQRRALSGAGIRVCAACGGRRAAAYDIVIRGTILTLGLRQRATRLTGLSRSAARRRRR